MSNIEWMSWLFLIFFLWKYSNKRRTGAAAPVQGRSLSTITLPVQRLIEGSTYSGAALIRENTVG